MRYLPILNIVITLLACASLARSSHGDNAAPAPSTLELEFRLEEQALEIQELRARLDQQEFIQCAATSPCDSCDASSPTRHSPVVVEEIFEPGCLPGVESAPFTLDYYSDYEKGFVPVRPVAKSRHPFELKINGWIQFRYHGFTRDVDSWTDSAGVTRPVLNRNAFDIERARLVFSGYAQDPRLTYFLQLDGDTDGGHTVDFFDYWWGWKFNDQFRMQFGKRKVSAGRQWLLGARRTRLSDRPMSCDFFRPDRTVGVFGIGKLGETGHYEVMVGNGYNSANLPNSLTDDRLTFAATNYFDPFGNYGGQIVDFDCTSDPLVRFGHSFVYSPQASDADGIPIDEADFVRLTDGTRLTETGALAPNVTVSDFDIYFYGIDAAFKWHGWSANAELFLRWIENIRSDGALTQDELFQHGFYVEGGHFIIPKRLDWNLRYSEVRGEFGNRNECAGGINWYPLDKPTMKITFDVTALNGSPLQNRTSDILVGDNGTLFRTQFQAEF